MARSPLSIHFDLNLRRDHQKISFERRDYESVDEKSLSYAMSRKTMEKKIRMKRVNVNLFPYSYAHYAGCNYFQNGICGAYVFIYIIIKHMH